MASSSVVLGNSVLIDIPGCKGFLHPMDLGVFKKLSGIITNNRMASVCHPSDFASIFEGMSEDLVRVAIAEVAGSICEQKTRAMDVSFDDIMEFVLNPLGMCEAFNLCLKDESGNPIDSSCGLNLIFYAGRHGQDTPKADIDRWLVISGVKDEPVPLESKPGS